MYLFLALLGPRCCMWAFLWLRRAGGAPLWFSLGWLLLLWNTGSRAHGLRQLWHKGLSCSLACGPGIEPESSALAGGFFATGPPEKSCLCYSWVCVPSASFSVRLTFVSIGTTLEAWAPRESWTSDHPRAVFSAISFRSHLEGAVHHRQVWEATASESLGSMVLPWGAP